MSATRIPTATYRLQFHKDFGFAQAQAIIEYLKDLGISDVYASPLFKARTGSGHGYDVVDHSRLDPVLGSEHDFENFASTLRSHGLSHWLNHFTGESYTTTHRSDKSCLALARLFESFPVVICSPAGQRLRA